MDIKQNDYNSVLAIDVFSLKTNNEMEVKGY